MADQDILVEKAGGVAVVTLNRPHRLNALSSAMLQQGLPSVWTDLQQDKSVRVVIFTGAGDRAFCSGMDVKEAATNPEWGKQQPRQGGGSLLTARQHKFTKPVIAAVNGICSGGGLMFVSDADISIASESATFFNPGVAIGQLATFAAMTWSQWVPFQALMRMTLVGGRERISAREAKELGIVTEVVAPDKLMPRAKEVAGWIAEHSPAAVRNVKRMLWEAMDLGLQEAHANGMRIMGEYRGHPDMTEGPRAFAEKRKPKWADD
jgi:enoyl-CoA hydratase/carnithine racemase